jgi:hypothetical protein
MPVPASESCFRRIIGVSPILLPCSFGYHRPHAFSLSLYTNVSTFGLRVCKANPLNNASNQPTDGMAHGPTSNVYSHSAITFPCFYCMFILVITETQPILSPLNPMCNP